MEAKKYFLRKYNGYKKWDYTRKTETKKRTLYTIL